jgi:hypothetical protein
MIRFRKDDEYDQIDQRDDQHDGPDQFLVQDDVEKISQEGILQDRIQIPDEILVFSCPG